MPFLFSALTIPSPLFKHFPQLVSIFLFDSPLGDSHAWRGFLKTSKYKGRIVRIKELQFESKKGISREMMKEMKLMREFQQDNVNSFFGACVDMTEDLHSITLITDYCSKGSLHDVLGNTCIHLDPMFISSLIHDLIKVKVKKHRELFT